MDKRLKALFIAIAVLFVIAMLLRLFNYSWSRCVETNDVYFCQSAMIPNMR